MKRVEYFGYSRKSPDDKQGTELSIQNQNELHKIVCDRNGWHLNSIEVDKNISGGNVDRKGVLKQIEKAKRFKELNQDSEVYLGVKDSKRFARNSSFFKEVWEDLNGKGIKIFSISKNGFLNYSDIGDRIIGVVDEQIIYDAKKYAELTKEVKIKKGLPCIPAPFGYKYKNKEWVIDVRDAKKVRRVVLDNSNKVNHKETIKDLRISKGKYYRILKNYNRGLYSGWIVFSDKDGNEIRYKGVHEPIISDTIDAVL